MRIDCTASAEVAAHYPQWLAAGIDIVTPNKHGPSASAPLADTIAEAQRQSGARLLHETTVGAQLPLLRIYTLGRFAVMRGEETIIEKALPSQRGRFLLAWLAATAPTSWRK